jgi:hypothetical protein
MLLLSSRLSLSSPFTGHHTGKWLICALVAYAQSLEGNIVIPATTGILLCLRVVLPSVTRGL